MHLKQLEAFYWAAKLGGFRAAARRLGTTQPTISTRIRELERLLGTELFDRSGGQAVPTARGMSLIAHAQAMLQLATLIREDVGDPRALDVRVRLGVTAVPAATWLPALVRRLHDAYPGILAEITVDASQALYRQLCHGDLDVALLSRMEPAAEGIATRIVGRVDVAWLAAPEHAREAGRPASPQRLARLPVITDPRGHPLYEIARGWFAAADVMPRIQHACASLETRIRLAAEGVGVALAAPAAAEREIAAGRLQVLAASPPLPALDYVLATAAAGTSPGARIVAAMVVEAIAQRPALETFYAEAATPVETGRRSRR